MKGNKEVYSTSKANIGKAKAPRVKAKKKEEIPDAEDAVIEEGAVCNHNGCNAKFRGDISRREPCLYHPGAAVFHEGNKYWGCCKKGSMEFEEMVRIPGCFTGKHKFVKDLPESGDMVHCRVQSYQTPSHVCLSIFAKGAVEDKTSLKITELSLDAHIEMQNGTIFERKWDFPYTIDEDASEAKFYATKVELMLAKKDGTTWDLAVLN